MARKTTEILYWDWAEQVDTRQLNAAMKAVYDGTRAPSCILVDSQSDAVVMVVSAKPMTGRAAQRLYDKFARDLDKEMNSAA